MDLQNRKDYFYQIFFTLILAVVVFIGLKYCLPDRLFPENLATQQTDNIVIDSLALQAIAECELNDSVQVEENDIPDAYILSSSETMEGYSNILRFYGKLQLLESTKKGKVRIAYFSDSMTDGDLIVQDIRKKFQERYGGKGVGFVGVTSLSAPSRYSVSHKYSKNWHTQSFLKTQNPKSKYGIDGQVSYTRGGDTYSLDYKANDFSRCEHLYNPTLFFGRSSNSNGTISVYADKDTATLKKLVPDNIINTINLTNKNPKKINIQFHHTDSIPFYGVNFDNGSGVYIDNFSMRGNSGLPLSVLNTELMKAFDQTLHYDLIIMHYGANVFGYKTSNYDWYERRMTAVTEHLKECFTNADILIVSTADKASKYDMEMKTDVAVEPLAVAQKYYASHTNSAFINLYKLMGGNGSMVRWVEEETPALANKDYTHFTTLGSRKIASLIYKELENGYSKYLKAKESKPTTKSKNLPTGGKTEK